ncbi:MULTISPECIES: hypothetical protein [unclassified Isoptericola]|uniref:hypothetical protein n=1 Tax=unclassified Isoptericola TaxID=2623355 RepID=UPI002713ACD5|nr:MULTISPECIES: hypothetical protein [unclassified Isoptericola]MDO8149562.1 hypothetical protein [Isoptericola sp. b515]MDO8152496.1 hypothetical protein [Isoptericola sp. b408]
MLSHWHGVPARDEILDVVVDPEDPSLVAQAGAGVWGTSERSAAVLAATGLVVTAILVPAAVTGLVRRRRTPVDG